MRAHHRGDAVRLDAADVLLFDLHAWRSIRAVRSRLLLGLLRVSWTTIQQSALVHARTKNLCRRALAHIDGVLCATLCKTRFEHEIMWSSKKPEQARNGDMSHAETNVSPRWEHVASLGLNEPTALFGPWLTTPPPPPSRSMSVQPHFSECFRMRHANCFTWLTLRTLPSRCHG